MEPTIVEVVSWVVIVCIVFGIMFGLSICWHDPKNDDPYRYCPKDDEK